MTTTTYPTDQCTSCLISAPTAPVVLSDGTTVRLCWDCAADAGHAWDYCPCCDQPTTGTMSPIVPGDRNSEVGCHACALEWRTSHTWDDAAGEWIEACDQYWTDTTDTEA